MTLEMRKTGNKQRDGDCADDAAHDDYHYRLDERGNVLDGGFEFFFVKDGHFVADLAEPAALFAGRSIWMTPGAIMSLYGAMSSDSLNW